MKFKVEALTWKRNILKNKMFHLALYFDEKTNEVKGKCKLKPYKSYFAFEIREDKVDN